MLARRARSFLSVQFMVLGLAVLTLLVLCVFPFLNLFERILFSGENGAFSLQAYKEIFASPSIVRAIVTTLATSSLVTLLALLFGVPLAWLLSRTDLPRAKRYRSWLCLPFAIPPAIGAISWIYLANPTTGLINQLIGHPVLNIYSFLGLVFVESSFLYTFVLLAALNSMDRMDSSLEEAARLSGASGWRVFTDVTLPLTKPSLMSGGLLVFLATAASFGVPALIGGPGRLYLMTTQIYTLQKMGTISGLLRAGALSSVLMIAALVMMLVANAMTRKNNLATVSGKSSRPSVFALGRYRWFAEGLVLTFFTIVFILPVGGILLSSLSHVQGELSFANLTFENWQRVFFEVDETPRAIVNSLLLATGAATLALILGALLAYLQIKTRLPGRKALDVTVSLPYATPGTVVALALVIAFQGAFLGIFPSLYNTLGLILIAYLIKYLSFAVRTAADGLMQIDDVLAEAARVSGASWWQTMTTIWLPLLKPALFASWFLVFMPVLSELTMTIVLTGPGLETIGTVMFQLQEYADASGGGASVLAFVVIIAVIAINALVKRVSGGRYGL